MKTKGIDRVVYITKRGKLEEMTKYLEDLLDIKFDEPIKITGGLAGEEGGRTAYSSSGLEVGEPPAGMEMEGLWGFVLRVPNLDEAKAEMAAKKLHPIWEPVVGKMREAVYNPLETRGIQICLCEYPDTMPTANLAARVK
jgi:hypothetical protein